MLPFDERAAFCAEFGALTDIAPIKRSDFRAVYSARSERYGDVILKLSRDRGELSREHRALELLHGRGCCRALLFDEGFGALITERVLPGTPLRSERDVSERVRRFLEVFSEIHIGAQEGFPTYLDWLTDARNFAARAGGALEARMARALDIGRALFAGYPDRALLHGDLHHDNMLLNALGGYTAIDPKGVIGPSIFDLPRFVLNEVSGADEAHIRRVCALLSDATGFSERDIHSLFYMEAALAAAWDAEDGMIEERCAGELAEALLAE